VTLIMMFEVSGADGGLPVTEERQLYRDGSPLLSSPRTTTANWPNGRQRTQVSFQVPAGAVAGAYVFEGVLRGAGSEQKKRAVVLIDD
jgi:hypothetical protein